MTSAFYWPGGRTNQVTGWQRQSGCLLQLQIIEEMDKLKNRELLSIQTFAVLVLFAACSALLLLRAEEVSQCVLWIILMAMKYLQKWSESEHALLCFSQIKKYLQLWRLT